MPDDTAAAARAITVHHVDMRSDVYDQLTYGDLDRPTPEQFDQAYTPAETIRGASGVEEAYRHAQGFVVNQTQGGRHMVRSAMAGDVFEVHRDGEPNVFYLCESIGFSRIGTMSEWAPTSVDSTKTSATTKTGARHDDRC